MVISPVLLRKDHQVPVVLQERLGVKDKHLPGESKNRRRGFPLRWSQTRSVDRKLGQGVETAGMADHGFL